MASHTGHRTTTARPRRLHHHRWGPLLPLQLALVLLMITGVHFVEAYGLNPAIYSAHLKLHPLLVLTVLVVAEHSLGVWGLLLAVPLTVFALDYVVLYPEDSVTAVATKELENVSMAASMDAGDN